MPGSARILTKLTLVPIHFFMHTIFQLKKEKTTWIVNEKQWNQLMAGWKRIEESKRDPLITLTKDKQLISYIRDETQRNNKDNISRTRAYLAFFNKHPEIHWAFLAHMVSRNAGYFMTDLKGEFLPSIVDKTFSHQLYSMIEQGNSMIFMDAYPQLLLYEASKRQNKPLFHLSKAFHVSSFMEGVWELFFRGEQTPLLPVAQIINEQSHIEQLLLQNESFKTMTNRLSYRLSEWLQLSQILLPALPFNETSGRPTGKFNKLEHRIRLGKSLYSLLFAPKQFKRFYHFAKCNPHTGSRSDYDPYVFTPVQHSGNFVIKEKLSFFKPKKGTKIYSPKLDMAWNITYEGPFFASGWFTDPLKIKPDLNLSSKTSAPILLTYWAGLHKIETAYLLKESYRILTKKRHLHNRRLFKK